VLVEQMLRGVPYDNLRLEVQPSDLAYFFEGLGYWGPLRIEPKSNPDGRLKLFLDSSRIDKKQTSLTTPRREKVAFAQIGKEAEIFVEAANDVIREEVDKEVDNIAESPKLFPYFVSKAAAEAWLANHTHASAGQTHAGQP
jgi:hypothetical protein